MPRRKVSLFGVNFDSVVTTVTSFALSAARPTPGTANRPSRMMADPARSGRRPRVEWQRGIEKCPGGLQIGEINDQIGRGKQAYDRRDGKKLIAPARFLPAEKWS